MYPYKDIYIQMVDTPPITNRATQSRLYGLLRTSDVFVFATDLTNDPKSQTEEVFSELSEWGFELRGKGSVNESRFDSLTSKPTIIACNKADIPGALDQFEIMEQTYGNLYTVIMASAEEEVGLDDLGEEIFDCLKVMRVYTKSPRERMQDFAKSDPIVLPIGSTVADAATQVHKDLNRGLKYAILWGESSKFDGQRVGKEHQLVDEDVIEIHI
jgi:hypothetical protein